MLDATVSSNTVLLLTNLVIWKAELVSVSDNVTRFVTLCRWPSSAQTLKTQRRRRFA